MSFMDTSFPRCDAEPSLFIFVYLHGMKAGLFQKLLQLFVLVDGHAADLLRPLLIPGFVAAAFIADEEHAAGLENPVYLPKALQKVRPEINRFKSCGQIELRSRKQRISITLPCITVQRPA